MRRLLVAMGALSLLVSCTEPGETTGMAAATGGAVGAGLGAIIGSQTGSTGAGLLLGSVGGAATGAAIGNAIEAKQVEIRSQDEAIERQEKMIAMHRGEIEELRRAGQESIGFKGGVRQDSARAMPQAGAFTSPERGASTRAPLFSESDITPVKAVVPNAKEVALPSAPGGKAVTVPTEAKGSVKWDAVGAANSGMPATPECARAQGEIAKADSVRESADKLFHVRRALRFCPESAALNNSLGELYLTMNRKQDAEFAFREAVRLAPGFAPAQKNLSKISKR